MRYPSLSIVLKVLKSGRASGRYGFGYQIFKIFQESGQHWESFAAALYAANIKTTLLALLSAAESAVPE